MPAVNTSRRLVDVPTRRVPLPLSSICPGSSAINAVTTRTRWPFGSSQCYFAALLNRRAAFILLSNPYVRQDETQLRLNTLAAKSWVAKYTAHVHSLCLLAQYMSVLRFRSISCSIFLCFIILIRRLSFLAAIRLNDILVLFCPAIILHIPVHHFHLAASPK